MASKNIHIIKKAIYDRLSSDSTLESLLGGDSKIFYYRNVSTPQYPAVVYRIITEVDNVYQENCDSGNITETTFEVTVFCNDSKSETSDNIEARIKTLLHGQRTLDTNDISCYSCFKQYSDQKFEEEMSLWITTSVYRLVSAPK